MVGARKEGTEARRVVNAFLGMVGARKEGTGARRGGWGRLWDWQGALKEGSKDRGKKGGLGQIIGMVGVWRREQGRERSGIGESKWDRALKRANTEEKGVREF